MPNDDERKQDQLREIYRRLNARFYTAEPADYFDTRWLVLMLLAGRPKEVLSLLGEGITYQHIHALVSGHEPTSEGIRNYVVMESQVLLHQASETLLRLYLAHAVHSGCAWLDVAAERSPGAFKGRVEEEILIPSAESLNDVVAYLFLGSSDPPDSESRDDWQRARGNLVGFLRHLARTWLDDAPLYNSLKHGLSVVPGATRIAFAPNADLSDARDLGHGASIEYLEDKRMPGKRRSWNQTTRWIDESETLALATIARQMIESLWTLARARHGGGPAPAKIFMPTDLTPASFRSPNRGAALRWSASIGIEEAP